MARQKDEEAGAAQQGNNANADEGDLVPTRSRWATRKLSVKSTSLKRLSLRGRKQVRNVASEKKRASGGSESLRQDKDEQGHEGEGGDAEDDHDHGRQICFNLPLPEAFKDEEGHPKQLFVRNKIRTSRYTPLTFIPMNLFYQFNNIANFFFLVLIILVLFPIFGGTNPGLNAVPLIFIVCVTAIKDAVEDYRRTSLDNELNNAPVYKLHDWTNVNVEEDNVSKWRRFKKANTRFFGALWYRMKGLTDKEPKAARLTTTEAARPSVETRRESIVFPTSQRQSFMSGREDIQMTPVQSPHPQASKQSLVPQGAHGQAGSGALEEQIGSETHTPKGDLINRSLEAGQARFHKDAWKSLQVGDFVRIYSDEEIPADIIILATSDPDGACYVETKNLDGETNLKVRSALRCGRNIKHALDCARAQFIIESEAPQANLYKYSGAIKWQQQGRDGRLDMSEPISIDNMLLRGYNLRNTEWALGVVAFTGNDTKIMMNQGATPTKKARVARELNKNVIYNFVILTAMCLVTAIANGIGWSKKDSSLAWFDYGSAGGSPGLTGLINFFAAVIVFQNLIPISLYISIEIVRTLQAWFIHMDVYMYYEELELACVPKSWNISDDVGQIEYIFSDKTGTLTQNVMEFKKATINGQPYGEAYTEAQAGLNKRMGVDVEEEATRFQKQIADAKVRAVAGLREIHDSPYFHEEDLTFIAPDFVDDLSGKNGDEQRKANERFMLALALCHTVMTEKLAGDSPRIMYKAQSPDEAALVATARDMGFVVLGSTNDRINLCIMGKDVQFSMLQIIDFNSSRKRMSAIVRMPDGKIKLFCKGADSIIWTRLKRGEQRELRDSTAKHLEMFAVEGFRTLCIAEKDIGEDEYQAWKKDHDIAATAVEDREEKLELVADKIEQDLMLLGGTAIEDRLQDGVPDTIALLGNAGIKLWVLTGDKVETAINIGFSCNLLGNDMDLIRLQVHEGEAGDGLEEDYIRLADEEVHKGLAKFNMTGSDEELKQARKDHEPPAPTHALVVDGFTLRWVLSDEVKTKFLLLCKQCKSVLCCRVSPAQKAAVVAMVKHGLDVMTLSIGDGANDVAMIQEADVGVGIAGEEGRQAVMSSDYAIAQFRFLQRLVLVHGRWSYHRVAETMCNFFYKNMVWTWAIFWYQVFCDFDVTYVFNYMYILFFNLLFTSVPVILMGVLDQDVSDPVSLAAPQLYRRGIERLEWTQTKFWAYMIDGIYQSVITFFIPYIIYVLTFTPASNGRPMEDRQRLGLYMAHPAILTINFYILLNTYRWDWLMLLFVNLSWLCVFILTGIYTSLTDSEFLFHGAPQVYRQLTFWMTFIITPIICIAPRFAVKCMQKTFWPYDGDIVREQEKMGMFKHLTDPSRKRDDRAINGAESGSSRSSGVRRKAKHAQYASVDEDRRPIYPPSVATHNTRAQNGSDGTNFTLHTRPSTDLPPETHQDLHRDATTTAETDVDNVAGRPSIERTRPSYDRLRASLDRVRASYEASNDITTAAHLSRIESSHSNHQHPSGQRRFHLTTVRNRGLSVFSKKSLSDQ